jgi:hypothetical protein
MYNRGFLITSHPGIGEMLDSLQPLPNYLSQAVAKGLHAPHR